MNEQPQPPAPVDDDGSETRAPETHAPETHAPGAPARSRPAYLDPSGSESTRELRDTARRRRDSEEKLQQHLLEAKEHAHQHDEEHQQEDHQHDGHHDAKQKGGSAEGAG